MVKQYFTNFQWGGGVQFQGHKYWTLTPASTSSAFLSSLNNLHSLKLVNLYFLILKSFLYHKIYVSYICVHILSAIFFDIITFSTGAHWWYFKNRTQSIITVELCCRSSTNRRQLQNYLFAIQSYTGQSVSHGGSFFSVHAHALTSHLSLQSRSLVTSVFPIPYRIRKGRIHFETKYSNRCYISYPPCVYNQTTV